VRVFNCLFLSRSYLCVSHLHIRSAISTRPICETSFRSFVSHRSQRSHPHRAVSFSAVGESRKRTGFSVSLVTLLHRACTRNVLSVQHHRRRYIQEHGFILSPTPQFEALHAAIHDRQLMEMLSLHTTHRHVQSSVKLALTVAAIDRHLQVVVRGRGVWRLCVYVRIAIDVRSSTRAIRSNRARAGSAVSANDHLMLVAHLRHVIECNRIRTSPAGWGRTFELMQSIAIAGVSIDIAIASSSVFLAGFKFAIN
jgi:hypothetical protein